MDRFMGISRSPITRESRSNLRLLTIPSLVDDTHSAATEPLDDAVMRDGLADHWGEILGLKVGQVNEAEEVG